MAPRRAAAAVESQPLYADSDEEEEERPPPKHSRQSLRKRISDVYTPVNDGSFAEETSGRPPLRSVNMNDDAAEKRNRRKSTKITAIENPLADPSSDPSNGQEAPAESSRTARQKQQLSSVIEPPLINVSKDVMNSNFEQWMKMATDNKINAANSWNFALIDYFHDMSLLRNNDDNSINFQRASCTLDGCVKIWTSRVDSVGTETGRLLSNLASDGASDDEGNGSDSPDAQDKPNKRKHRAESTLAKNPSQLRNKKPDLEFSVDPLFKKTCADFDEGGAQGLLMNHLSLGGGSDGALRVVFDASDSVGKLEDEVDVDEPEHNVDLTELRRQFLPDLAILQNKAISHSLADFSFSKDAFTLDDATFLDDTRMDDDDDEGENEPFGDIPMDNPGGGEDFNPPEAEDFFMGEQAVGDEFNDDFGGDNQSHSNGSVGPEDPDQPATFVPFDPRRAPNERDLVMAMTEGDNEEGMMDYFDQNFMKNWAGPEHWKLRKVAKKPDGDATKAKPRLKKEPFKIDFTTPMDPQKDLNSIASDLFAPTTKGVGINMPGTGPAAKKSRKKTVKEKRDDHRLPDDMHFSSRQLVTLFLKPKFSLKMRGQRVLFNDNGDGEVDENFWAQAAAEQAAGSANREETADGGAIPFNTQFFHEDYDDGPGFDDPFDGPELPPVDAGEQDLLAATQGQSRRVKPEFVKYTRRAKRVDVRKLKENIWSNLSIVLSPKDEDADNMDVDAETPAPTEPTEARAFSSVISGLQRSYPREKMEDISTSFCFICLLHLANEQGLKLESMQDAPPVDQIDVDEEDADHPDRKVGNIWDLKVYRDPTANQSS